MLDFENDIKKIHGWLTKNEANFLYEAAKGVKQENAIVEIGSWKGKSTVCLGRGVQDGNQTKIYAIDPHKESSDHKLWKEGDTFEEFLTNVKTVGVSQYIEPIRDTSENAANNFSKSAEFIFIDGDHAFGFVSLDFRLWFPKLIDGGVIAFHDTWHRCGPNLATAIALLTSSKIKNPRLIDAITCFEKVKQNSCLDHLKNICFLFYRSFFGIKGFLKLSRE